MSRYIDLDQIEFLKVDGNEEFNHGVDCCINRLLEAEPIKAVSLDKVKKAREEIDSKYDDFANIFCEREQGRNEMIEEVLEILDKLIESEEK